MRAGWCWAIALWSSCDGGETSDAAGDDDAPEETDETPDDSTDSGTTPPEEDLGCYAEWVYVQDGDTTIDGTGIDIYDPVRTDLLIHSEREYNFGFRWSADYTYDDAGNLTTVASDGDGDGKIDYFATYTYDDDGRLLTATFDEDGDGDIDYAYQYVRDEEGRRVSATEDVDGDGETDRWYVYTYDSVGRVTQLTGDDGNDGTIDYLVTYTYQDPELVIGTAVVDDGNDGIVDELSLFVYSAAGQLQYRELDLLADGYFDAIDWYMYDPVTGLLAEHDSEEHDAPPDQDNVFISHTEYTYDVQLRLVEMSFEGSDTTDGNTFEFAALSSWTFAGTCP